MPVKGFRLQQTKAMVASRFWSLVDTQGPDDCWPWLGSKNTNGYGSWAWPKLWHEEGLVPTVKISAHKVALVLSRPGIEVPTDLDTLHSCDNRSCCNPQHLSFGTRSQNMQDCIERGRHFTPFRRA